MYGGTDFGSDLMAVGDLTDVDVVFPANLILWNDDLNGGSVGRVGNRVVHDTNSSNHFPHCEKKMSRYGCHVLRMPPVSAFDLAPSKPH